MSSQQRPIDDVVAIIRGYVKTEHPHDYLSMLDTNDELESVVRTNLEKRNYHAKKKFESILRTAVDIIKFSYAGCTLEEKKKMALYTWYVIYIDDTCTEDIAPVIGFQHRFLHGLPQLDHVLDGFASLLHEMREQYDDMFANALLSNTFDFVIASVMEASMENLSIRPSSNRFPRFLRERTALGISYAVMVFPKSRPCDFLTFYQALPDMDFWIASVNDFLSFYKEEINGETATYVHNCADAEDKNPFEVVSSLKDQIHEARQNIAKILGSSPVALAAWSAFQVGYVAFHLLNDRYKLKNVIL